MKSMFTDRHGPLNVDGTAGDHVMITQATATNTVDPIAFALSAGKCTPDDLTATLFGLDASGPCSSMTRPFADGFLDTLASLHLEVLSLRETTRDIYPTRRAIAATPNLPSADSNGLAAISAASSSITRFSNESPIGEAWIFAASDAAR
jgi:hypothetical protein